MNKAHTQFESGLLASVLNHASQMAKAKNFAPKQNRVALTELAAFCLLDPCLAALHKDFLNAKAARVSCQSQHGADDPMAEMAAYVEDAAWCSLQTRYMELRSDRILMRKAQHILEQDRIERAAEEDEKNRCLAFAKWMMMVQDQHDIKAREAQNLACFMLMVALFWDSFFKPNFLPAPVFNQRAA
jgi:hypothetical protein